STMDLQIYNGLNSSHSTDNCGIQRQLRNSSDILYHNERHHLVIRMDDIEMWTKKDYSMRTKHINVKSFKSHALQYLEAKKLHFGVAH
ncbi:hypothetical protein PMAYCL1PPCAC_24022, partial [Pristionchus mayeri]